MVVLTRETFPETTCAEVTAYFSDSPGDHELLVLRPELPATDSLELVYTGTVDVRSPKTVSHAECRVSGLDTAIFMAGLAGSTDGLAAFPPGVVRADASIERGAVVADGDDEGIDLVTAADLPPAAVDAEAPKSAEETGVAGPLAALKSLSQTGTAHSSCADLTLSDLKDVSDQTAVPADSTDAPAECQEPAEAARLLELDPEVESDSVSINELRVAAAMDDLVSDAGLSSELSSEPECVELQELVDGAQTMDDVTASEIEEAADVIATEAPAIEEVTAAEPTIEEPTVEALEVVNGVPATADAEVPAFEHVEEPAAEVDEPVSEHATAEQITESTEAVEEEPVDV
ncbi:hypothetical protein GGH95_004283, partial [Coemansia sp. RSA 1836]